MTVKNVLYSDTLVATSCGVCAIPFALPSAFHEKMQQEGTDFWCPNGHKIAYSKTENQKLKEQLALAVAARKRGEARQVHLRDQLDAERRSNIARKGHLTRLRNRIANGVCPCCNRSFQNVRAHMRGQHADWIAAKGLEL